MQLGDLDLLGLLVLLNLLNLDIMNSWLSESLFNKTDWIRIGADGITDRMTSDSGNFLLLRQ